MSKWQPIATVPDGKPVLVTDGKHIFSAERDAAYRWWHLVCASGYEWEWDVDMRKLTHWMPMPPLPQSEEQK